MPGPSAVKLGDVWVLFSTFDYKKPMTIDSIYGMNGKSVEVEDTDGEGRLVLSGVIPFSDIFWTSLLIFLSRRYLLHGHGQATYFDRRGNSYRVIFPPTLLYIVDNHLDFSAMDVALGEIYTGVFSVRSCSVSNSFDIILIANWFRLRTSSGKILKQQELPNMIVFGVCLLMTSMVLKSILQTQISKTSELSFFFLGRW